MRAVVTGASAGLGAEFARQLAAMGHDLVLTARRAERLEALAAELRQAHSVQVEVIPLDLGTPEGPLQLFEATTADGARVDMIINNAGFGFHEPLIETTVAQSLGMIDLNIRSLVELSHRFALHMLEGGAPAHIINVGSTGSFQAVPGFGVYAASKAFVASFSEALAIELRGTPVRVTVVHPGPTRTEFMDVAGMEVKENLLTRVILMDADAVVREGLRAALRGRVSVVTGWINKLTAFSTRLAPRRVVAVIAGRMMNMGL